MRTFRLFRRAAASPPAVDAGSFAPGLSARTPGRRRRFDSLTALAIAIVAIAFVFPRDANPAPPRPIDPAVAFHLAETTPAPGLVEVPRRQPDTDAGAAPWYGAEATVYLHPEPILRGTEIASVRSTFEYQLPVVEIALTAEGTERLAAATAENVGRQMAVVARGQALTVATIQGTIPDGRLRISNIGSVSESVEMVRMMHLAPDEAAAGR